MNDKARVEEQFRRIARLPSELHEGWAAPTVEAPAEVSIAELRRAISDWIAQH
ncbi:hypothetical protein K0028_10940 [Curtobacterium flaccumfaciens pv. flaccumfaciens]|uniref:hypothetical protein n=1 Tax=Curtobacterium flaccumfaciens TaxID=2035 RepID=UPI0021B0B20E|nr:hypothetical protein [Curtobacterium flaccumfaciens]QYI96223.1 hypothetical protein K0028_10940 [Curtobacterium flaccumfaciens pv. flaccumfaciens]